MKRATPSWTNFSPLLLLTLGCRLNRHPLRSATVGLMMTMLVIGAGRDDELLRCGADHDGSDLH